MEALFQTVSSAETKMGGKERENRRERKREKVTEEGQRVTQEMKSDVDSCY